MKRSNHALVFYLSVVFLSGLLAGGLGGRVSCTTKAVAPEPPRRLSPEEYRKQYMDRMNGRLHLTPEQSQNLEKILDKTRARFHEIRKQQTDEINVMLKPEQQTEYAKYRQEREELRKQEELQRQQQQQQQQKQSK